MCRGLEEIVDGLMGRKVNDCLGVASVAVHLVTAAVCFASFIC